MIFSSGAPTPDFKVQKIKMGALTLGEGALPSASVLEGLPLGHYMTSFFFALSSTPIKNHNIAIIYPPPLVSIGWGKVLTNPLDGRSCYI